MYTLFNALLVTEAEGEFTQEIKPLDLAQLPDNDLLIQVKYSCINFKDALSASGNKGVTKKYPHVPGVDAAGIVIKSKSAQFAEGDEVLITGFDMGMNTWGGFGEYISVPAAWALPLPAGLSLHEAMSYGTAGLTAALSVHEVIRAGIKPERGPVAVSGATGGVGGLATAILAKLGYEVTAISGKNDESFLLNTLGASSIINRAEFTDTYNVKPLATPAFAAAIDTTGGAILSGMLKATQYGGVVTCCGMVAGTELSTTIFPFILRGVHLAGIDSVMVPLEQRRPLWELLASEWKPANLSSLIQNIRLPELPAKLNDILHGQAKGRYVLVHD
ncbi:YhdH/YhfP family quinone oxidoreductase [Mucilaginibacter sp. Bleaf8]|uniref:YhdH/YhfP family quinone oxidoreductase n=1 Tax=Mucilaginibacter sp. Bleaf8 TaxID=2834430 RepID=UPI001BCB193C|nr:YhdH/YhfP family quinone oxidoreductase [Mucilaginibacter sp. Bleaf8]MBS7566413.1 YhdH/YhfP family quinone oxidoreductase [Mucilaginibacter sp. Bleaf8]